GDSLLVLAECGGVEAVVHGLDQVEELKHRLALLAPRSARGAIEVGELDRCPVRVDRLARRQVRLGAGVLESPPGQRFVGPARHAEQMLTAGETLAQRDTVPGLPEQVQERRFGFVSGNGPGGVPPADQPGPEVEEHLVAAFEDGEVGGPAEVPGIEGRQRSIQVIGELEGGVGAPGYQHLHQSVGVSRGVFFGWAGLVEQTPELETGFGLHSAIGSSSGSEATTGVAPSSGCSSSWSSGPNVSDQITVVNNQRAVAISRIGPVLATPG